MESLDGDVSSLVNIQNIDGRTALFDAKDPKTLTLLIWYGGDPSCGLSKGKRTLLEVFLKTNPENARALLNLQVEKNDKDLSSKDLLFIYNFRLLQSPPANGKVIKPLASQMKHMFKKKKKNREDTEDVTSKEMVILSKFLTYHQKSLLSCPVAESYLHLKWWRIKSFFYFNVFFYSIFLMSLSSLVCWTSYEKAHIQKENCTELTHSCLGSSAKMDLFTSLCTEGVSTIFTRTCWEASTQTIDMTETSYPAFLQEKWKSILWLLLYIISWLTTLLLCLREMLQMSLGIKKYILSKENLMEIVVIVSSVSYLIVVAAFSFQGTDSIEQALGAIALFLGWIEMTMLIGRFPSIGIYTYMSTQVIQQLLTFFSVYFTTLVAFALCFNILLPRSKAFENPASSLVKVLVMMIGEFDYNESFTWDAVSESGSLYSNFITQIIFILLILLVSIIIANLVIGLTVNNTRELFQEAGFYRLGKTVMQIQGTESIFLVGMLSSFLHAVLPRKLCQYTELLPCLRQKGSKTVRLLKPTDDQIQVCVKPLNYSDEESFYLTNIDFKVYLYERDKEQAGKFVSMTLPKWVIDNTLKALEQRQRLEKELNIDLDNIYFKLHSVKQKM
jgi:hypothetical protein